MSFLGYPEYPYFPFTTLAASAAALTGPFGFRRPFVGSFGGPFVGPGFFNVCNRGCAPWRPCGRRCGCRGRCGCGGRGGWC